MKNSGISYLALGCYISRVADSSTRLNGTSSNRTNCIYKRCKIRVENKSTPIVHRQQIVLQATTAACSVDSTSHESFTESSSDRSMLRASDCINSANSAQHCDLILRESHINESPTSNYEVGSTQNVPRRYLPWNQKLIYRIKITEKRRRLRQ